MKKFGRVLLLTSMIYCGGVSMAEATNSPSTSWVTIHDATGHMTASFPHQPIDMSFELPFQNTPAKGQLHLFSASTPTSVFLLSALNLPSIQADSLKEQAFKQAFETYVIPRLFYSPQIFRNKQTFSAKPSQFKDHPSLDFQFSYQDKHALRWLKGIAFVKDHTLYTLFYLASKHNFKEEEWQQFAQSFILKTTS